jgi:HPt (histidine-containing phosphotransfer) domain-containing protein
LEKIVNRFRFGLSRKLLTAVVLTSSTATFLTSIIQIFFIYRDESAAVGDVLESFEKTGLSGISKFSWDLDQKALDEIVRSSLAVREIASITVSDLEGKNILSEKVKPEMSAYTLIQKEFAMKSPDGEDFGVLRVQYTRDFIMEKIKTQTLNIVATNFVKSIFVSFLLFAIFQKMIIGPLKEITRHFTGKNRRFSGIAQLTLSRKSRFSDEFDGVVQGINERDTALNKLFIDNTELIQFQEELVRTRTASLMATTEQLGEAIGKIKLMLNNINVGILTFHESFIIHSEYSAFLSQLYGVEPEAIQGKDVFRFIFQESESYADRIDQTKAALLYSFGGNKDLNWELNNSHLIKEAKISIGGQIKFIELDWTPIVDSDGAIYQIMLCIRDLTIQRAFQAQAEQEKYETARIMTIITEVFKHRRQVIRSFLSDALNRYNIIYALAEKGSDLTRINRELHNIKGTARSFQFTSIIDAAHNAENIVKKMQALDNMPLSPLIEQISVIGKEINSYERVFNEVLGPDDRLAATSVQTIKGSLHTIIAQHLPYLQKTLESGGCQLSEVSCSDSVINWRQEGLADISTMIIHGMNNAVDHGYLLPRKSGMDRYLAKIDLVARCVDDQVLITIRDYGFGLQHNKIQELLRERGIDADNEQELVDFLFRDGISTAGEVTYSSGRGVGLSAIRALARKYGGDVTLRANIDQGMTMEISLQESQIVDHGTVTENKL